MTVTYTAQIATCTGLGCFWKVLFRWKGSIWKLLWPNLLVYVALYYAVYGTYLLGRYYEVHPQFEEKFKDACKYCKESSELVPLSFVLGFYVNLVVKRWWEMYQSLPSTDTLALFVSNSIHGQDERCRMMRRTIMRYVNLSYVMILCMISTRVKKRFPSLDHLVEAGVMLANEKKIFEDLNSRSRHAKYWMPLVWAGSIIARARKEGRIRDDFAVKTLLDELCIFRSKCGALNGYDWVQIPLVYTQVVTVAVYMFFAMTLMGRQLLDDKDVQFPFFAILQFFFYMGWLKVAESLVNPFGEDDDDFETNWLVDRNLQVAYLIVDEMHAEHPELIRDQYWDAVLPDELPHTVASQPFRSSPYMGSTAHLEMSAEQAEPYPTSATPQLHRLDEESDEDNVTDEEMIPMDLGESGLPLKSSSSRLSFRRQNSVSERSDPANSLISRKPSIASVFHRVFNRDNSMGSRNSLNKAKLVRSMSSASKGAGAVSRPHSPYQIQNGGDQDIFKMSDLSINESATTPKPNNTSATPAQQVPNKNLRRKPRYGNKLTVMDQDSIASGSDTEGEDAHFVVGSVGSNVSDKTVISGRHSPVRPNLLSLAAAKPSPKPGRKLILPSPQHSPLAKVAPVSFFMGSEGGSQTDKAAQIPMADAAESAELAPDEIKEEKPFPHKSLAGRTTSSSRDRGDSIRESELEPIDEQTEANDTSATTHP